MVHVATLVALLILVVATTMVNGSIATALLQPGDSFLIREGENAKALVRDVPAGHQRMDLTGRYKGKWISDSGKIVKSSNFRLFQNGSVLIKSFSAADAGTYQKDPNPMIRIGDMGYAPPVLIIQLAKN